jgi:hemin uptake protein HemP
MPDDNKEHCETYVRLQKHGLSIALPKEIEFDELACGKTCVYIKLNGEVYRLQLTKNQKLILTK